MQPVKNDHFVVVGNIAGNDTEFHKIEAKDATHAVNIFCEILRDGNDGDIFIDVVVAISEYDKTKLSTPYFSVYMPDGEKLC